MSRIGPRDPLPCGCVAMGNSRVLLDGVETRDVKWADPEAGCAEVLRGPGPDGKWLRDEHGLACRQFTGRVEVFCRVHSEFSERRPA